MPPAREIALALVVRGQNFRTIYFVALPSHELDDGIGKLAFDFASKRNGLVRLYVQNRARAGPAGRPVAAQSTVLVKALNADAPARV